MTDVLMIDWLGRGGIAQTTDSFVRAARAGGLEVAVVSRSAGTLSPEHTVPRSRLPGLAGSLATHLAMTRRVVEVVHSLEPRVVYLQNYWIPTLESRVLRAAQRAGAVTVVGVHNHEPHELRAGVAVGLRRLLDATDRVVTHSQFVADHVARLTETPCTTIQLPLQTALLETVPLPVSDVVNRAGDRRILLTFGVLGRRYKGGDVLDALEGSLDRSKWCLVAAGVGASTVRFAEVTIDRFLSEAELHWLVKEAYAVLLPYRQATQSGAVVLAQALGSPPIVPGVGGIPEQVRHEVDGILLPADASPVRWLEALEWIDHDPLRWRAVALDAESTARQRDGNATSTMVTLLKDGPEGIRADPVGSPQ